MRPYLLQPLGVILHYVLQLLDLLAGKVWHWRWGISLQRIGIVLDAAGLGVPAGGSSASLTLRQDERVGALAVLDPVQASVAAITTCAATCAAAAAATAAATAAALRPPPLLPFFTARNHQKRRQREPAVAKVVPQHHIRLQVSFTFSRLKPLLCCCGAELPLKLDQTRLDTSQCAPSIQTLDLQSHKLLQTWTHSTFLKSVSPSGLHTSLTG